MREETRRKLDGFTKRQKLRRVLIVGGALIAAGALYAVMSPVYSQREVSGLVQRAQWARGYEKTPGVFPDIEVVLDSGPVVSVGTMAGVLPEVGSEIVVIEEERILGITTYRWAGPGN
jgi:hypothetical protein